MRKVISLLFIAAVSSAGWVIAAGAQTIPNVPDTARSVTYNVTSSTTNFDVPFNIYGDCSDLLVKVNGVAQSGGFTCISKSGSAFASVAQPVTDAQVVFANAVANTSVEIIGNRRPRFAMATSPGISRVEFNRTIGTIISRQRESYERLVPLGANLRAGFGAPIDATGISGDYYYDLGTGNVYGPKTSTWPSVASFTSQLPYTGPVVTASSFGIKGDDSDETAKLQAMLDSDAPAVYLPTPPVKYKATSQLTWTKPKLIYGDSCVPYTTVPFGAATQGKGSWLHLAHLGTGILISNNSARSGYEIRSICTERDQPAAAAGWAPVDAGYDILAQNATVRVIDVMFWNATRGLQLVDVPAGSGGHKVVEGLRGQTFKSGIFADGIESTLEIRNTQLWPFWWNDGNVNTYALNNNVALSLGRVDNPIVSNFFSIWSNVCIGFYQTASGASARGEFTNTGCDAATTPLLVDSTVTVGVTPRFANAYFYGSPAHDLFGSRVLGNNSKINMVNVEFGGAWASGLTINGTGNTFNLVNVTSDTWNQNGTGAPLIAVGAGNTVNFVNPFDVPASPPGPFTGGAGTVNTPITLGTATDQQVLYRNGAVVGGYTNVPVTAGGSGVGTIAGLVKGNGTAPFSAAAAADVATVAAGSATPAVDGTGSAGTSPLYSRQDHIHPTDTTRAPATSGSVPLKGNGAGGTAAATAADMATLHGGGATPLVDGTAAAGTSSNFAREDHRHPTDTTRASTATTVTGSGSITGGGDLSGNRVLAYAGDGAWPNFTPTVTSSGTLPTTATAASSAYLKGGTRYYTVTYVYTVTTLGPGTAGVLTFTLPNGSTSAGYAPCFGVNNSAGTATGPGYIQSGATTANLSLPSLAAQTYSMTCIYQSTN